MAFGPSEGWWAGFPTNNFTYRVFSARVLTATNTHMNALSQYDYYAYHTSNPSPYTTMSTTIESHLFDVAS